MVGNRSGSNSVTFSAVLFDLDGTLLDTLQDLGNAVNRVLERNGMPPHDINAYRTFVGDGVHMLVRRALPESRRDPESVSRMVEEFRLEYRKHWKENSKPYPGVAELLDALSARRIPMAVLSNKPHDFTSRCVEEFLGKWAFAAVLGEREGVPRKPDPAGALEVARKLGIRPEAFVYLGDSSVDMETARAAGMVPVGALWGFRTGEELMRSGAHGLLERPEDLLRFF